MAEHSITFSLTNIMKFISFLAPLLISFFMIMYSILTNNVVKGLIFVSGIVLITFITYILKNLLKEKQSDLASPFCNIMPFPFTKRVGDTIYSSPSMSSTIIGFTVGFLTFPMYMNNNMNPALLTTLLVVLGINATIETMDKCTTAFGTILGSAVGILFGILYYTMIKISGNENLAYFAKFNSNNTQCKMSGNRIFRCNTRGSKLPSQYYSIDQDVNVQDEGENQ